MPFQKAVVVAEVIVMPRSCSCSIPVHYGRAVVHFANLVRHAGVEEDALGSCRFAGIDVSADSDVSIALDRSFAGHVNLLWIN